MNNITEWRKKAEFEHHTKQDEILARREKARKQYSDPDYAADCEHEFENELADNDCVWQRELLKILITSIAHQEG